METISTSASATLPTGCCPPFDPFSWDGREVTWQGKPFLTEHIHQLFHVPLDMGRKITRANQKIGSAGASPDHPLMLADDKGPWRSDLLMEVTRPVPGAEMATLSGTFLAKVFDGPFKDAGRWMAEMQRYVASRGKQAEKLYLGYTTCPACAKAYGHNYVVVLAQIAGPVRDQHWHPEPRVSG